jgi:Domain of unknown function (DUF1931)
VRPIMDDLAARPPLNLAYGDETEARLGGRRGASFALARCFKIVDPDLKNPQPKHWERSVQIVNLLL